MSPRKRGRVTIVGALALAAIVAAVSLGVAGAGAGERSAFALPRAQTLYMSGNQWSPNNDLNPVKNWDYVTGLVGFVYETPFRYDPLKDQFIPWLATGGKWTSKTTYVMNIRPGVKWSDGQPMTAKDVVYTFNTLRIATHPQHALWATAGLTSVKAAGNNVVFRFAGNPGYQEFDNYRFNVAIVPQHVFKNYSKTDITTGNLDDTSKLVGTGPYLYQSGVGAASAAFVWKKNSNWWATKALGLSVGAASTSSTSRTHQRGGTVQLPRREHRPLQQLRTEVRNQRASSRPTTTSPRTTSARTRRGCSRTRRGSRSTTRRSVARWPSRST